MNVYGLHLIPVTTRIIQPPWSRHNFELNFIMQLKCAITLTGEPDWTFSKRLNAHVQLFGVRLLNVLVQFVFKQSSSSYCSHFDIMMPRRLLTNHSTVSGH